MAVLPIVVWPDARLRQETRRVEQVDDAVRDLYRNLVDTMYSLNGLGIAAVQIGDPTQMFIVEPALAGRDANDEPVAFINPEVVWTSEDSDKSEEGCLSFPGIYVQVDRPAKARVRALGIDGEIFEVEAEGLFARCLLHENDHLTGKLLVDFVGPLKRQMIRRKLNRQHGSEPNAA
ncbi:peptide deformylase [Haliangium ochraceum]|uniref:Peptide deformylase n=1 Tax=Haliangium ochraceum (strain DSM 14365 / JCM 11303 / SMP-2) TaxID=502025 RepID=D0LH18_HALO1|nr:peptide deformylase [Haliangium ochraceum]ACY14740.1 peptide deformylase [Haliangium ochraceum DSM 14365]